jgi:hypothetical protein
MIPTSGAISLRMIANEIGLTGPVSLEQCVNASRLTSKSKPHSLGMFRGYIHTLISYQFNSSVYQAFGASSVNVIINFSSATPSAGTLTIEEQGDNGFPQLRNVSFNAGVTSVTFSVSKTSDVQFVTYLNLMSHPTGYSFGNQSHSTIEWGSSGGGILN